MRFKVTPALADFLDADFKELFKTASVLVLRLWLQFRSFIGSASRKKLKLLLYRHVYPFCLRVVDTVEQLQATVMVYSSMDKDRLLNENGK